MEGYKLYLRLGVIGLLVMVILFALSGQLYWMQIVRGETYAQQSERITTRTLTVPAARGEILDRYGRPLITNTPRYALELNPRRAAGQAELNEAVWELLELCHSEGVALADTLPLSDPPLKLTALSSTQNRQMTAYLKALELDPLETLDAEGLTAALCERYELDPATDPYRLRRVLGVRYELDLREVVPFTAQAYKPAEELGMDLIGKIRESGNPIAEIRAATTRTVNTDFAAHLLGLTGPIPAEWAEAYRERGYAADEIVGLYGAEHAFESRLRGLPGTLVTEVDSQGKVRAERYTKPPEPGKNVMLTVDIVLQEVVERVLEKNILQMRELNETLKGKEAEGGAAVVIDVRTGELLAAANYPTYRLRDYGPQLINQLNADPARPLFNRAVAGTYEPGSTFKMVTASAALREGIVTTSTRIRDLGRYTFYPTYQPRCWIFPGSHGSINVSEALKVSCNYFFYDVGRQATIDAIGAMAAQYGLGRPTGIELSSEATGSIAGPATAERNNQRWFDGDTLQAAIGQSSNLFTPLQMANYVATIANGGTHYAAHLLKTVKSYDYTGTFQDSAPQVLNTLDLAPEYLTAVQQGMRMVAQPGGTAAGTFAGYPVPVAAKTGSVQATDLPNDAVFVAYAPYDDPEIAIAVVVEKGGAGSQVAPIARDIFDAYFRVSGDMGGLAEENTLIP